MVSRGGPLRLFRIFLAFFLAANVYRTNYCRNRLHNRMAICKWYCIIGIHDYSADAPLLLIAVAVYYKTHYRDIIIDAA